MGVAESNDSELVTGGWPAALLHAGRAVLVGLAFPALALADIPDREAGSGSALDDLLHLAKAHPQVIFFAMVALVAIAALGYFVRARLVQRDQALSEAEVQMHKLLVNSPEAMVVLDEATGKLVLVNDRACEMFQYSHQQMMKLGVEDITPPQQPDGRSSPEQIRYWVDKALDGETPVFEWMHQNRHGDQIPCEVRLVAVDVGKRRLVRGSLVDISRRQRAEEALRRSEERYRGVVETQQELLMRWTPDGTRTFVNQAFCRFFNLSPEHAIGSNFIDEIRTEENRLLMEENLRHYTPASPSRTYRVRIPRDHDFIHMEWTDQAMFDDRGKLVEIQSVGRDITEQRAAEIETETAWSLLTAAVENTPAGIIIADAPDLRIRMANSAIMKACGGPIPEAEPLEDGALLFPDGRPVPFQHRPLVRAVHRGETVIDEEYLFRRPDGEERWLLTSASPIMDSKGNIIAGVAVSPDITERKTTELAMRALVESLAEVTGQQFFDRLVTELGRNLGVDIVFAGELVHATDRVKILSLAIDGVVSFVGEEYDVAGSPTEAVTNQKVCVISDHVSTMFPDDPHLNEYNIKGYVGVPLFDRNQNLIGVLAAMSRRPIDGAEFKPEILELFGARAATELERARAAEALMQSEERFRTAFDEAPIGSLLVGRDGRIRRVNDNLCAITRQTPDELSTMRLRELVHPDDLGSILSGKARLLSGDMEKDFGERRILRKDGTYVWVNYSVRMMNDPSGEPIFLIMMEDISQRKRAEEVLRTSTELQRMVVEMSTRFIGAATDEMDVEVESALQRVGAFLGVDRVTLYRQDDQATAKVTHRWWAKDLDPLPDVIPLDRVPVIGRRALRGNVVSLGSVSDLPQGAERERELFERLGIKAWIVVPLLVGKSTPGLMTISTTREERSWPDHLIQWLRVFGEMVATVLARKEAEDTVLSSTELQRITVKLSSSFLGESVDHLDAAIDDALLQLAEFMGVGRCGLAALHGSTMQRLNIGTVDGSRGARLVALPDDLAASLMEGSIFQLNNVEELKPEHQEIRGILSELGIKSWLAIPVRIADGNWGVMTLSQREQVKAWPVHLLDGLRVFGEMLATVRARLTAEQAVRTTADLQNMLVERSSRFIAVPAEQAPDELKKTLKAVSDYLGVDRITFFQVREDNLIDVIHQWGRHGVNPVPSGQRLAPLAGAAAREGRVFKVERVEDLPPEASEERRILTLHEVKSWLVAPVNVSGRGLFVMSVASLDHHRDWPDYVVQWLRVFGEMIFNVIARKDAEQVLRASSELEQIIAESSAVFVAAKPGALDREIQASIARIREFLAIDHAGLYERQDGIIHERCCDCADPGNCIEEEALAELEFTAGPGPGGLKISDKGQYSGLSPADQESFRQMGVSAWLGLPVRIGLERQAELVCINREPRAWRDHEIQALRVFGDMLGGVLARAATEQTLRRTSALQQLLVEFSARFMQVDAAGTDAAIEQVFQRIGDHLDIDRVTHYSVNNGILTVRHAWCRDTVTPIPKDLVVTQVGELTPLVDNQEIVRLEHLNPEQYAPEMAYLLPKSLLAVPISTRGDFTGCLSLSSVTHATRWPEHLVQWHRVLADILGTVLARRESEEKLTFTASLQEKLVEFSARFIRAHPGQVDREINSALAILGEFIEVDRLTLYTMSETDAQASHAWHRASAMPAPQFLSFSQVSHFGPKVLAGETVKFSSVSELPEIAAGEREAFGRIKTKSWIVIPVAIREKLVGCFSVATQHDERQWPEYLVQWLRVFGELLSGVLARQHAEEELLASQDRLRALATQLTRVEEQERRRIATFLHDQISQALAVLRMRFGLLQQIVSGENAVEMIREIRDLIEETIDDTQTLTFELSPPVLHELGLWAAIEWVGESVCGQNGLALHMPKEPFATTIDPDIAALIYRSVRELLTNIVKHAQAQDVKISYRHGDEGLSITVEDNGAGFDTSLLDPNRDLTRFGLFSIRERLGHIGGRFKVESRPGRGTRVTLLAPLHNSVTEESSEAPVS
ncbi:MAG: PAS domain S-box protein [Xanthomonadales bacterium]|nr:PAS domain S-box protein [Xanthomonadales bacterium]